MKPNSCPRCGRPLIPDKQDKDYALCLNCGHQYIGPTPMKMAHSEPHRKVLSR